MELRDALIPALVHTVDVERETHNVSSFGGPTRAIAGRRHIKLTLELFPRSNEELDWLFASLQENGNRVVLMPDGSPIIHPKSEAFVPAKKPVKTDSPKDMSGLIW